MKKKIRKTQMKKKANKTKVKNINKTKMKKKLMMRNSMQAY